MNQSLEEQLGLAVRVPGLHLPFVFHKKVFLVSLLAGFLTHAYCMLNMIGTEDTLGSYSKESVNILSTFAGASTGRWLSNAVNWVQTWYRTPFISGLLILLVTAWTAQLVIDFFHIESTAGQYLAAILLEVSSPTQAYMTLYEVGYPVSVLLACLAALLIKRAGEQKGEGNTRGSAAWGLWVGAWLSLSLSLVILPVNLTCTLTLLVLELILQTLSADSDIRRRWQWIGKSLLVVLLAGAFLLVSSKLLMGVYEIEQTSYQGAEAAMSGAFAFSLAGNYLHAIVKLGIMGLWKIQILPLFRFSYYLIYLWILVCIAVLFVRRKRGPAAVGEKRQWRLILAELFLWALLVPVAVCTMSLLSYGFMYRGQHRMSLMLLILVSLPLVERVLRTGAAGAGAGGKIPAGQAVVPAEEDAGQCLPVSAGVAGKKAAPVSRGARLLYWGEMAALVCMIYGTFLFDNVGYANQHHVMTQDRSLCTRILSALDGTEGFTYDQPVYFLNILSWDAAESVSPLQYDPELYSVIWPVATTDLYAYEDASFRTHMRSYEGVVLAEPSEEVIAAIKESGLAEEYEELASGDFRIVQAEGTWVVVVKTVGPPNVLYG